ncbi:phospho-sugar mutase [bacterium]|nr:phospho-sugar mutase [bacterium]
MDSAVRERINEWLTDDYDANTRKEIEQLLASNNEKELIDRFYQDLDFGTGGMRSIIGAGTNRINIYTIAKATQGLANYILKQGAQTAKKGVAIAHDSRHMSPEFALVAAQVLAGNGIKAYLFKELRPTPLLSFSVRHLRTTAGIVVTASHNPKEYNGYKVYWEDGGQVVAPHDVNIIKEVRQITSMQQVKKCDKKQAVADGLIVYLDETVDNAYLDKSVTLSINRTVIRDTADTVRIVYTPIHGTGITLVPAILEKLGFRNVHIVEKQRNPDANFSTVVSPNPEEGAALELAIADAKKFDADLVLATDPDADRLGIAVKDNAGSYILLNGNQIGSLLVYYVLSQLKEKNILPKNGIVIKTIVTTELQRAIASHFNIECIDVLTGFKFIAEKIRQYETDSGTPENPQYQFLAGGEESYGYLVGTFARDKDAVVSAAFMAEIAAFAKSKSTTIYELLQDIYRQFGFYDELLKSLVYKGKEGSETIEKIMREFRENPPKKIGDTPVVSLCDYQRHIVINPITNESIGTIDLPRSNVLAFHLEDETRITIRPSGTEPKIKIYFGGMGKAQGNSLETTRQEVQNRLGNYLDSMLEQINTLVNE